MLKPVNFYQQLASKMNANPQGKDPAPISVLSLNPSLDMTYEVSSLLEDQKAHALATRYDPGGNGINVGRALKRLDTLAHNYCVIAGEIGQLLHRLLGHHLDVVQVEEVAGETRINGTVLERESRVQYEVSGIGPPIPDSQLQTLLDLVTERSHFGFGVLTGSLQKGLSSHLYAELVEKIHAGGGRAVVDAHDEVLRHAVEAGPFLIKPNRHELETLLGQELASIEDVATQARKLQRRGVTYVCVSLGAEGALLTGPDNTHLATAPDVPVDSTVGSGDSLVAGMLAAFAHNSTAEKALCQGVACGAGTVQQAGTELFDSAQLPDLLARVGLRQLDI